MAKLVVWVPQSQLWLSMILISLAININGDSSYFSNIKPRSYQDYVYGTVIGAAIGDALGRPVEFLPNHQAIKNRYYHGLTSFADFKANDFWLIDGKLQAAFTDDTQMAVCVLDVFTQNWAALNENNFSVDIIAKVMSKLAARFVQWRNDPDGGMCVGRAPGNTCLRGCSELEELINLHLSDKSSSQLDTKDLSNWWERPNLDTEAIQIEGGCGSVMRAWPIGLVLAWPPGDCLVELVEQLAVSQSKMTHRHPKALAACAALAVGVHKAVRLNKAKPVEVVMSMINSARKYDHGTADLIAWAYVQSQDASQSPDVVLDRLQAWAADEAVAAAVYIYMLHPNDLAAALKLGANTTGDSDTIATLAGALVGAYAGISSLGDFGLIEKLEKVDDLKLLADAVYTKHYVRMLRYIIEPDELRWSVR